MRPPMLLKGTILRNRYQIIKHLGSGGFADTYLSEDRDLPGNPQCVVKNLKPTSPNPTVLPIARRLFETEAQVLYLLGQHEQIPKLFAHFEENGEFYLVQEFVDGYDLSTELTPGRKFSEQEVIKLLQDILEVLVVVHQRNIIHRDIKPQNIMRRRHDGKIVLIDFGAVKEIGSLAVNTQGQVRSTITIGTPGYMPNEQANRDPRLCSDIYAVGMIGILALTGLLPQQLLQDPTTGELNWRNYVQVSNELAEIVTKMVRYHFSQRYQSAYEALQAINAIAIKQEDTLFTKLKKSVSRVSRIPKSILQGGLIAIGGLGIGAIATFAFINRSNIISQINPTTSPSPTITSSSSPTSAISSKAVNWAIPPRFDGTGPFYEGLADIKINGKWGYIDKSGTMVIPPQFDEAQSFSEGLALVWISGQNRGYIDKTGRFAIPQQFAKNYAGRFSEGLAWACVVSSCGYIDKTGRFLIDRKFTNISDFSEGLAAVRTSGKWGYINQSGNFVIQPQFDGYGEFREGLAGVKVGDKWGYIDNTGNTVIQLRFDRVANFTEGLAAVKIGDKWGYIDKTGNTVIDLQFDDAYNFSEDLAVIKIGNNFGYVDKTGKIVIKPQFAEKGIRRFSEGLAAVKIGEKWGYIDKSGNTVIEPQFDDAGTFAQGLAWATSGDKTGYIRNPLR
jgi:serine/threonine protein kinase